MGFSGIVSTMIMFIAVVAMSITVVGAFKSLIDDTSSSIQIQGNALSDQLKTDLFFDEISYSNITDITTVNIKNTGKTKLQTDKVDIYLDGLFIDRNESNRTINIQTSTDLKNPGIWDPGEIVQIKIFKVLEDGDHTLTVSTQYSTKAEDIFSST